MEIEQVYDEGDLMEIKTLKTPGIQLALDAHCTEISLADKLKNLRKALARASIWLNRLDISSEHFAHDYNAIHDIIMRVANRRIMGLTDPNIKAELDEHCIAIGTTKSSAELQAAHLDESGKWSDRATADKPVYRPITERTLSVAAFRSMIRLLVESLVYKDDRDENARTVLMRLNFALQRSR
jgi:hypothetical protein